MQRRRLSAALARLHPPVDDPEAALREQRVEVDGAVITNPGSMVRPDASIVVRPRKVPRGVHKLGHALDALGQEVDGAVAVDLGACTGGFTRALLDRGAARVFAVESGHGQLLGSLLQDPRVVNLERTNLSEVTPDLLGGHQPDLVVADVTMLTMGEIGRQVAANGLPREGTSLVGLVKPIFELGLGEHPEGERLDDALALAVAGLAGAGWEVLGTMRSEVVGGQGAIEFFAHARWPGDG
jgi:23S rRNA (cytidine1920-2'-O)/16S rRNA (cytidine1409-2'-O)-methyltransferase